RRPRGRAAAQPLRVLPQRLDDGLRLLLFRQLLRQGGQLVRKTGQASGGAVGQHLRRRQDPGGGHVPDPPLGAGVEGAHGVDLIVKKLAPHRLVHQGREHVQNAAPQGELAHALH
ncbi:Lineage-specific thermal regulator protein, partial [Dysosmobacter welbionis]